MTRRVQKVIDYDLSEAEEQHTLIKMLQETGTLGKPDELPPGTTVRTLIASDNRPAGSIGIVTSMGMDKDGDYSVYLLDTSSPQRWRTTLHYLKPAVLEVLAKPGQSLDAPAPVRSTNRRSRRFAGLESEEK